MPHIKNASDLWYARWSKRLESVRKDVECAFGIVKKRFRIVHLPFPYCKAKLVENVFRVCVMLHNRLLARGEPSEEEFVEAHIEHSKTKHSRWVTAVGSSKGPAQVQLAQLTRDYWHAAGFKIVHRNVAGFREEGPDYMVLRVSLVALAASRREDEERLELLGAVLSRSRSAEARKWASYSVLRARQRLDADSLERKFINVIGGPSGCEELGIVSLELTRAGFGDRLAIVPGPLMRATHGEAMGYAHMPIQPGSTYSILHDSFDEAFRLANADSPDPELDLRGLAKPLWGHHSNRRGADSAARETREETGATEQDIDLVFGWQEAFYSAKMQLHYEGPFDRVRRAAVTSRI